MILLLRPWKEKYQSSSILYPVCCEFVRTNHETHKRFWHDLWIYLIFIPNFIVLYLATESIYGKK